ncbi:unnamed protein product [Effrenium voratum]|uniref:DUF4116 domain-containing protein n=1 Tax=Effrenium voratum TaxID=2562239 RepID=A0AA36J2U6_9DINO|nr:unnamed protein product [Effrenium voratum]
MLPDLSARTQRTPRTPRQNGPLDIFEHSLQPKSVQRAKLKTPGSLESWLDTALGQQNLQSRGPCPERLKVFREVLAWLCDLLPSYRLLLLGALEEVDAALRRLEELPQELHKLRSQNRTLSGQLQALEGLSRMQLEEAWSAAQKARRDDDRLQFERRETQKEARRSLKETERKQLQLQQDQLQELRKLAEERSAALEELQLQSQQVKVEKCHLQLQVDRLMAERQPLEQGLETLRQENTQLQLEISRLTLQLAQDSDPSPPRASSKKHAEVQPEVPEAKREKPPESLGRVPTVRANSKKLEIMPELPEAAPIQLEEGEVIGSLSRRLSRSGALSQPASFFASLKRDPSVAAEETDLVPDRPEGMASGASEAMRRRQWETPQNWTLSIDEWDRVLAFCQEQDAYLVFKSHGKKYVNMYDLNQEYVKPWTRGEGCGVAVMMSQHREDSAQLMLSHAWAEDVEECQSAVMEHVRRANVPRSAALWFCLFANYQVGDEYGPSIEAQLSLKPFASVISAASLQRGRGYGLHAIHTSTADLYKRLWCVHEVERALKGNVDVSTSMSDLYKEQTLQRLEFFLGDSCKNSTWEDCMWAANVKVKTIQARCDRMEDEKMLISEIMATGGFERIDATIERFRAQTFGENYDLMLKAVGRHGQALKFASFELLERKLIHNLVRTAVRSSGLSLMHAPPELRKEKELVMEAVRQNGMALQFAAEELRVDPEVVREAVSQEGLALEFAAGSALEDGDVILAAVAQNGEAFKLAPESMRTNRSIVERAVQSSPKVLQFVPPELQKEALEIVKSSPEAVLQLERSETVAGIVIRAEKEIERMDELASSRRHMQVAEKTQERLQQAIELMKSVRPHVATQKPKQALRLLLLALHALFERMQDPTAISEARRAIEKQFNSVTEDQKQDYVDVLLDREVALNASLKSSLFSCVVAYKSELDKKAVQIDVVSSVPVAAVRRYSLSASPTKSEPRDNKRTATAAAQLARIDIEALPE